MYRFAALGLALISFLSLPPTATAQTIVDTANVAPGSKFLVEVNPDGTLKFSPIKQGIKLSDLGGIPTDPIPGDPSPLEAAIKARALEILAKPGATKQTAAGLSAAYSLVANGLRDGSIPPTSAQAAIVIATGDLGVMKNAAAADKAAWLPFKEEVIRKISEGFVAGDFPSKEALASFISQVHRGIDYATGIPVDVAQLQRLDPRTLGILDGIDLTKLIELIKLILELFKAFKGGSVVLPPMIEGVR